MTESEQRLWSWLRNYGAEKCPAFIGDLMDVLSLIDELRKRVNEMEVQRGQ